MAQSFNAPLKLDLSKGSIIKFGPAAGSAVALFGFLITALGFVLPWLKSGDPNITLSGLELLTKTGDNLGKESIAMVARGSSFNALICNLPFFLCGAFLVSLFVIVFTFVKKAPALIKLYGPIALSLLGLFSCCPSVLFFMDLQKGMWDQGNVKIQFGFYIAVFGLAVIILGGIGGIVAAVAGGALPKRNRS